MKHRQIEPAPSVNLDNANLSFSDAMSLAQDPTVREMLRRANKDYVYWDQFKYLPQPEGLDPKVGWFLLKLTRALDRRDTPVRDVDGHTFSIL